MPELEDVAALTLAQALERAAENALPFEAARVYSQHVRLRAGRERLPTWTDDEFQARLTDVMTLLDAADDAGAGSPERKSAYRRAAEILEWLDHPVVNKLGVPLNLLGAACYSLAGLPARAATLASHPVPLEHDAPLLRLLLAGDFPSLLVEAADAASTVTVDAAQSESNWSRSEWYRLSMKEVAAALAIVAADFRWGDEDRRQPALDKLRAASQAMRYLADPYSWLLIKLVAEVAGEMVASSLRIPLAGLSETASPVGQRAFEGYARARFLDRRSLAWPSQTRGLTKLTLNDSFALCTPTGSGKTTVAEVALLDGLFRGSESREAAALCLYIVPTRALAAEVESKLAQAMRRSQRGQPITVTGLYGGANWGPTDTWLNPAEPTVLICTQEKADALVRYLGWDVVARLCLVVVDEAHEVAAPQTPEDLIRGESRALRLETLISRLRARLPEATRFVAMSAVAGDTERPLAQWVAGAQDASPVRSGYRTTRQVVGRLRCRNRWTRIVYDVLDGSQLRVGAGRTEAFVPTPFPRAPAAEGMDGAQKALAPYAVWAALSLAAEDQDRPGQSVLISVASQVRNFAKWALSLLEQWEELTPHYFDPPSDPQTTELWDAAQLACDDYFGQGSTEGKLIRKGVLVYYGRMPGRLPRLIVQLAERRAIRIVIATSGLSQGVNLPFETVLIPMLRRPDGPMARSEFWNLVGRAGRPGVSTEGQTLVLINEDDTTAWRREQVFRDYRRLTSTFDETSTTGGAPLGGLIDLVRRRWPGGGAMSFEDWLEATAPLEIADREDDATVALDTLDSVLLAALEDAGLDASASPGEVEASLREFWRMSFSRYALRDEERLESILLRRGQAVHTLYSDDNVRHRIYLTSLPPRDAARLDEIAARLRDHLVTGEDYPMWTASQRLEFVLTAVEILAEHPRFAPRATVGTSNRTWKDVLTWWLLGWDADVSPTVTQAGPWHDFINNYFTYRFNWALGSTLSLLAVSGESDSSTPSFPEWPETGLPWIAVWLKDLLEWGTLEPVAAYLMARSGFVTRPEAESAAADYYSDEAGGDLRRLLNPETISEWARQFSRRAGESDQSRPSTLEVVVASDLPSAAYERNWRVVPARGAEGAIRWIDPSGRLLGTSEPPEGWSAEWAHVLDYELRPTESRVAVSRYL